MAFRVGFGLLGVGRPNNGSDVYVLLLINLTCYKIGRSFECRSNVNDQ